MKTVYSRKSLSNYFEVKIKMLITQQELCQIVIRFIMLQSINQTSLEVMFLMHAARASF